MTSPTRSRDPDEILRVAVIAPGKLRIPPHGWGAIERGIWNFHVRAAAHGIRATIVNTSDREEAALADPGLGERARREALERLDGSSIVARNVEVQREVVARWRRDGEAARRRQHAWVRRALAVEVRDPTWKSVLRRLVELRTHVVSRAAPSRSRRPGAAGRR